MVGLGDIDSRPAQGRLHSVKREHLLGVPGARLRGDATVPAGESSANTMPLEAAIRKSPCVRWPPRSTPCCHRPPRGGSSWPPPIGSRPDRARHLAGSLTGREAQVLACLGEGLPDARSRPGCTGPKPGSRAMSRGCWTSWAARTAPRPARPRRPVSSAGSPGGRSCRLELGLGARQAGLRPSPGRSCPPGAAGLTGASRPACCRGSGLYGMTPEPVKPSPADRAEIGIPATPDESFIDARLT